LKKYKPLKTKSCNYLNSLIDKEKAIISDGLSSVAPPSIQFSNLIVAEVIKIKELKRHFPPSYIKMLIANAS
jgi:hypothetical protein